MRPLSFRRQPEVPTLADLSGRLRKFRRTGPETAIACCPSHDDSQPSLSIRITPDRLLVFCHRGCSFEKIIADLGLASSTRGACRRRMPAFIPQEAEVAPWSPSSEPACRLRHPELGEPDHCWHIRSENGDLFGIHARWNRSDGKRIRWWRNGRWSLGGVSSKAAPLYGSERTADYDPLRPIYLTEGEKAADALIEHGHQAVATVCGAASKPCDRSLNLAAFRCSELYLWPDNDESGLSHMRRIHERLTALHVGIGGQRVVIGEELPPGGDAADYFGSGGLL